MNSRVLCLLILLAYADSAHADDIKGKVTRANGRPAAFVLVAAVPHDGDWWTLGGVARTRSDGTFRISGLAPGDYGLTATSSTDAAAFLEKISVPAQSPVAIRMGRGGKTLTGMARHPNGDPLRGRVTAARLSTFKSDLFVMETDDKGRFSARLPPARYRVFTEGADGRAEISADLQTADVAVTLELERVFHVTPPAVVDWVKREAIPLRTPEPGNGFDDMRPLRRLVGNARIVSLGEATHGTREFFQLKHRMLEFLVKEMGFTVFAIEASAPDTKPVNDYVLHGIGDPAAAVAGMMFWTWNTEEVVNMVRWMRAYNEDPRHVSKMKFYGFDMQNPKASERILSDYLKRVDPGFAGDDSVDAAERRLMQHREEYTAASSPEEWEWVRRQIDLIRQGQELTSVTARANSVRDRWMAANVKWILDHEPAGTKIVLWAHNGHVTAEPAGSRERGTMGAHLRDMYGDAMRIFGFGFDRGKFQAVSVGGGGLQDHEAGPAKAASFDGALAAAGLPLFVLDLRTATGVARQWVDSPLEHRTIGAVYNAAAPSSYWAKIHPSRSYDAVIFVANTTAARGLGFRSPAMRDAPPPEPVAVNLDFEQGAVGEKPEGWSFGKVAEDAGFTATTVEEGCAAGKRCARVSRETIVADMFAALGQRIDATPYRGRTIRLRAKVRSDLIGDASSARIWMRVDRANGRAGFFDNMHGRDPGELSGWTELTITGNVPEDAEAIAFGQLFIGRGHAWIDDVAIEVVEP